MNKTMAEATHPGTRHLQLTPLPVMRMRNVSLTTPRAVAAQPQRAGREPFREENNYRPSSCASSRPPSTHRDRPACSGDEPQLTVHRRTGDGHRSRLLLTAIEAVMRYKDTAVLNEFDVRTADALTERAASLVVLDEIVDRQDVNDAHTSCLSMTALRSAAASCISWVTSARSSSTAWRSRAAAKTTSRTHGEKWTSTVIDDCLGKALPHALLAQLHANHADPSSAIATRRMQQRLNLDLFHAHHTPREVVEPPEQLSMVGPVLRHRGAPVSRHRSRNRRTRSGSSCAGGYRPAGMRPRRRGTSRTCT